jgi:hypothetical protein
VKARWFVLGFGIMVVAMGAWILVKPFGLKDFADLFVTPSGLWWAAALRVTFGIALLMAAATSRMPRTLRVLGVLFIMGGLAIPVLGLERLQGIAEWGASRDANELRVPALFAFAMGGFIIWSVWPRRSES